MDVAFDVDGVAAELMDRTLVLAKDMFGVEILRDQLTHYNSIPEISGGKISRNMMYHLFDMAWADYHSMQFVDADTREIFQEVRKRGHRLSIISYRSPQSQPNCLLWFRKMVLDYDCLIFPDSNIPKMNFPWDLLVDDHPRLPAQMIDYPERKLLFRSQPWNRSVDSLPENVTRIESLREVLDYV